MSIKSFFKLYSIPFVILLAGVIFYYLIFSELRETQNKVDNLHAELNKRLGEDGARKSRSSKSQNNVPNSENVARSESKDSQKVDSEKIAQVQMAQIEQSVEIVQAQQEIDHISESSASESNTTQEQEKIIPSVTSPQKTAQVIVRAANIRTQPDKTAEIIAKVEQGEMLAFYGDTSGEWLQVKVGGKNGFIASHLVSLTSDSQQARQNAQIAPKTQAMTSQNIPLPRDNAENTVQVRAQNVASTARLGAYEVVARKVNIRSQPNTESGVMASVAAGKVLEVVSIDNDEWAKVILSNGSYGFVAARFLRKAQ